MILDALAVVAVSLLTAILQLVPAADPSAGLEDAGTSVGSASALANGFFPVSTLAACLVVVIGFRLFLLLWDLVVSLYRLFPFKAS